MTEKAEQLTKASKQTKKRVLTGDTPTGTLHLGHYVGTLENRAKLQTDYDTYIINADLHAFTTKVDKPAEIAESVRMVAIGNLAAGVDPQKATFFVESGIPEIYELAAISSMLVSHNRALRNPTIKDEIIMKNLGDQFSLGFINYPMYQVADILSVKAELVPVGVDQLPHIEQTSEVARKFNTLYGETFPEVKGLVGRFPKLMGTDGNPKMGKSLGNTIFLNENEESLRRKVMSMYTDPKRIHPTDPGTVEGNPVFVYHDAFNRAKAEVDELKNRYTKGTVGDIEVKEKLFTALNAFLAPIRDRHLYFEAHVAEVEEILHEGTKKTRTLVQETLAEVKEKMHLMH